MASTSSSNSRPLSPTEKYPCPPEFNVLDFVPKLLSDRNFDKWKTLMWNFIQMQGLIGLLDGTAKEDMANRDFYEVLRRSESLVQGWILATLTEETRLQVWDLLGPETAKGLWDWLEKKFNLRRSRPYVEEREMRITRYLPLYKAIIQGNWDEATGIMEQDPNAARTPISKYNETALSVASKSARGNEFVGKLLEKMTSQDVEDLVDLRGRNALHMAAFCGNTEGVKTLVRKYPELPNVLDGDNLLPVHYAVSGGSRETVMYLMEVTREGILLDAGVTVLGHLISGEFYDIALSLLQRKPELACHGKPSPLDTIAEKGSAFRSGNSFNFLQNLIYEGIPIKSESIAKDHNGGERGGDVESAANCCISGLAQTRAKLLFVFRIVKERLHFMFWEVAEKLVPPVKCIRERKFINHDALELVKAICTEIAKMKYGESESQFWPAMQNATRMGISEIVEQIIMSFPDAIYLSSVDDRYILQDAILERHERVFNLIYQLDAGALIIKRPDKSNNNGLHLAALLGHEQQINLKANVPVTVLQMQRELQWFKEVEKLLPPALKEERNTDGMTPAELFSKTHQDLKKEGENWMKSTANSCTIVAALIATMVFAAAITVPGGINNENGHPLLSKQKAFIIFGIADSLALFSSLTSVLMFLLILTSRYAEEDFLRTLPSRLIIGLVTLFISILSTMVASGAILYLIFGDNKAWVLIPLVALAIIPTTLFGALQFPPLVEMIRSTCGPSIFGKQSDRALGSG